MLAGASRGVAHWSCSPTPPNQKKEEENFLHSIFLLSFIKLDGKLVVFHVLSSIFKYSLNFIGAAGLKLGMLHYKFLQGFLYKT